MSPIDKNCAIFTPAPCDTGTGNRTEDWAIAPTTKDTGQRTPRRTVTYRGQSGCFYGFTEFRIDDPRPRAAGVYMVASVSLGPERWRIILIGETANFNATIPRDATVREARRRGASRILLHFSPLTAERRRHAAQDLWMAIRAPLVAWESGTADIAARAARRA